MGTEMSTSGEANPLLTGAFAFFASSTFIATCGFVRHQVCASASKGQLGPYLLDSDCAKGACGIAFVLLALSIFVGLLGGSILWIAEMATEGEASPLLTVSFGVS